MEECTRRRKDRESVKRWDYKRPGHPLKDPLEHYKQPLLTKTRGRAVIEFDSIDVNEIRREFGQNRRQFAHMIGVSRHTLRNWETGRRLPPLFRRRAIRPRSRSRSFGPGAPTGCAAT